MGIQKITTTLPLDHQSGEVFAPIIDQTSMLTLS
jgi:hypothetical protein